MHNRKLYLIYPPNYQPGDGFKKAYSRRQAWKLAVKMGAGASVDVSVQKHQRPRTHWFSSWAIPVWDVLPPKDAE